MGRLVHTGLGLSTLVATGTAVINTHTLEVDEEQSLTCGSQSCGIEDQPQCRGLWHSSSPGARSLSRYSRSPCSPPPSFTSHNLPLPGFTQVGCCCVSALRAQAIACKGGPPRTVATTLAEDASVVVLVGPSPPFHTCPVPALGVIVRSPGVMGRLNLVHTGLGLCGLVCLGSSTLVAHVLHYPPPPTRTAL
jgi:hypothetical protein